MRIEAQRLNILKHNDIYKSINYNESKGSFSISGIIGDWDYISIIDRYYFVKLEKLLYSEDLLKKINYESINTALKSKDLTNKTLMEFFDMNNFQLENIFLAITDIFDFNYFNIKKNMPYYGQISNIWRAISELLENTFKYTSRKYHITTSLMDSEYPIFIKFENDYKKIDGSVKENLNILKETIEEFNKFDNPSLAFVEIIKKRSLDQSDDNKGVSRLGFAKMILETNAKINIKLKSDVYKDNGITIEMKIPIELITSEKLQKAMESLLK